MVENVPASLLNEGETVLALDPNRRVGSPSQNFEIFRIGLIKDKGEKYVRTKLPRAMWHINEVEAKMVTIGEDRIIAILLQDATAESPDKDRFAVRQPNASRKDKPYFDMPVGRSSKMTGNNRYPKDASSMKKGNWWRVDIPGSVDLRKRNIRG